MNVEKLQQINALANELKKHNFAITNDDAFKQAEEAYGLRQQNIQSMPSAQSMHYEPAELKEDLSRENKLQDRRFELLLEMNNKKYDQEIDTFRSAINQLIGELNSLKTQMAELQSQPQKVVQKEKQTELKKEEPHPRQGSFKSDDVDIQKMFYFGNKR